MAIGNLPHLMYSSSQDYLPKFPFNNAETHSDLRDTLRKQAGFEQQEQLREQSVNAKRLADEIRNCTNYIFQVKIFRFCTKESEESGVRTQDGLVLCARLH